MLGFNNYIINIVYVFFFSYGSEFFNIPILYYLSFVTFFITANVASVNTIPIGKSMNALWINAASKYITNEIAATVIA